MLSPKYFRYKFSYAKCENTVKKKKKKLLEIVDANEVSVLITVALHRMMISSRSLRLL